MLASPFHWLIQEREPELRRRLDGSNSAGEFPLLDRFREEGSTDYLALAVEYGDQVPFAELRGMLCSFQTDRPGGFAEAEVEPLRRLTPVLALSFRSIIGAETANTLMATYLGRDAGRRVLAGPLPAA